MLASDDGVGGGVVGYEDGFTTWRVVEGYEVCGDGRFDAWVGIAGTCGCGSDTVEVR